MPNYSSKSQSKNGGRRKKQTKRKLRRGRKSRKVMRGGDEMIGNNINTLSDNSKSQVLELLGVKNPYVVTREQLKLLSDDVKTQLNALGFNVARFP